MKHELQNIISGKSQVRHGNTIQAISSYIRKSKSPSGTFASSKQIKSEETALIKHFLTSNGFVNTRNNDYLHSELGIILEDLHDENVLTYQGNLFFIDTVFYLTEQFYQ